MEADIDFFQWSTTETEYEANYKALVDKYTKEENVVNYTAEEEDALVKFFKYVDDSWGPKTPVRNWFAGSNPYSLTQNQVPQVVKKKVLCNICNKSMHPNSLAKHKRLHVRPPPASSSPPAAKRRCRIVDK